MMLGLRLGDPNDEILGAWLAKESVRDVYLTDDVAVAAVLLERRSRDASPTRWPRSARSATPSSGGERRS